MIVLDRCTNIYVFEDCEGSSITFWWIACYLCLKSLIILYKSDHLRKRKKKGDRVFGASFLSEKKKIFYALFNIQTRIRIITSVVICFKKFMNAFCCFFFPFSKTVLKKRKEKKKKFFMSLYKWIWRRTTWRFF